MKEHVEVFWFSEQPYGYVTDEDLANTRLGGWISPTPISIPRRRM